ncbi:MAG: hypothetical protein KGL53_10390 [Elusimicrobia bacterium]|nr:hypothetical protein [Elusimicrobiota bacterium]
MKTQERLKVNINCMPFKDGLYSIFNTEIKKILYLQTFKKDFDLPFSKEDIDINSYEFLGEESINRWYSLKNEMIYNKYYTHRYYFK